MSQPTPPNHDDDLTKRFLSFRLTDEEQSEVTLSDDDVKASEEECRNSLFGKIISRKPMNLGGLKSTMEQIWGHPKNFRVIEIGKGIYQFILPSETDVIRILNGKPWFFNNHFLILDRWRPNMEPTQYDFKFTPVWIQIWGFPLQFLSKEVGLKLGARIGSVDDVVMPVTGSKEGRFVRVRVHMDVTLPLKRGSMVKLSKSPPFWVEFRYERLPTFCHYCGLLGHDLLNCETRFFDIEEDTLRDAQYGPWIRASPVTQPGRRRPASPPAGQHRHRESDKEANDNLGMDGGSQPNLTISKFHSKSGEAGIQNSKEADVAHADFLVEARFLEKNSVAQSTPNTSLNKLTPLQGKAVQLWRDKNPIQPSTTTSLSLAHTNNPPSPHASHTPKEPSILPNIKLPSTSSNSSPQPTNSSVESISKPALDSPKSDHGLNPLLGPSLLSKTIGYAQNTCSSSPKNLSQTPPLPIHKLVPTISQNLPTDLNLVDAPISIGFAAKLSGKAKVSKPSYKRKGESRTTCCNDISATRAIPTLGKRKMGDLELNLMVDEEGDCNMAPIASNKKARCSDGSVQPVADAATPTVVETSQKWSPDTQ